MGKFKLTRKAILTFLCGGFLLIYWMLKCIRYDTILMPILWIVTVILLVCSIITSRKQKKCMAICVLLALHLLGTTINLSKFQELHVTEIKQKEKVLFLNYVQVERYGKLIWLKCSDELYDEVNENTVYELAYSYTVSVRQENHCGLN
mgnify:FL=1